MGQLLTTLNLRSSSDIVPEINFDIENATPSSEEIEIYNELFTLVVEPNSQLLKLFKEYQPASNYIRDAIASPNEENENRAWEAVAPTIDMLKRFYQYSSELERGIPMLLNVLCKDSTTSKDLERHPGLTKLFADILDFVFEFDYLKIQYPTIQNDFSYYRRALQRGTHSKEALQQSDLRLAMNEDDLANRISLFIAYPTPMLKCVIDTTSKYAQTNMIQKSTSDWLSSLWAVCYQTVNQKKKSSSALNENAGEQYDLFKVMVLSIILYDHIDPQGAFSKNSPIQVKNTIKMIQSLNNQNTTFNLISTLKYNSKHLNDDTTPKAIKNLIMSI